jgi:hypothetical protein
VRIETIEKGRDVTVGRAQIAPSDELTNGGLIAGTLA